MMAAIEIWEAAGILVKRYGDAADFKPCLRADKYVTKGGRDRQGARWAILKAIGQLQNVQPGEAS
jgi:hypothetical protein